MRYPHGRHGRNQPLRRSVMAVLSYGLSYRQPSVDQDSALRAIISAEDQGKGWWSQRDLNPCLSLESRC